MTEHTPGPWSVNERGDFQPEIISAYPNNFDSIAQIVWRDMHEKGETLANAHLIAAAPDLLAAGNEMYALLHDAANGVKDLGMALVLAKVCDRWDAAIKKVTGEA